MTWKEIKELVESHDVKDEDELEILIFNYEIIDALVYVAPDDEHSYHSIR